MASRRIGVVLAAAALLLAPAPTAFAGPCGLPDATPLHIEFSDGSVGFRDEIFGRPGVIVASSGTATPARLRGLGAQTVYWEMRLSDIAGTSAAPADPSLITLYADELFDLARISTGCQTPMIALNELDRPNAPAPWSGSVATYRANVLNLVRRLSERGGLPVLLVPPPLTTDAAQADWWTQVGLASDVVPEVYFRAPELAAQFPLLAARTIRVALRKALADFAALGVPRQRIGLMLGFQSGSGKFGREGLQPRASWLSVVKFQALAARQVAADEGVRSVWSWGWGTFGPAGADLDKPTAACVYLWARDPALCDAPTRAGGDFDPSLEHGPIALPADVQCVTGAGLLPISAVDRLAAVAGGQSSAIATLLDRIVLAASAQVGPTAMLRAESRIVGTRFAGSRDRYRRALAARGADESVARGLVRDELRALAVSRSLTPVPVTPAEADRYAWRKRGTRARSLRVVPAPTWLGGSTRGIALASLAPRGVFAVPTGATRTVSTPEGAFRVTAVAPSARLGDLPIRDRRRAAIAVLGDERRRAALTAWRAEQRTAAIATAVCLRDDLPDALVPTALARLPFLRLP